MIWILALEVTGPDGALALDEELELPGDRVVRAPDGRYLVGVYGARFDEGRGIVEVVAGRERRGRPAARGLQRSDELDPYVPLTVTLDRGDDRWTVVATLGVRYAAPVEDAPFALLPGVIGRTEAGEVRWEGPEPIPITSLTGARDPIATVWLDSAEVRLRPALDRMVAR